LPTFFQANAANTDPNFRTDILMQNLGTAALFLGMLYLIVVFLVWRGVKRVFRETRTWDTLKIFCLALLIAPILRASGFIIHFMIHKVKSWEDKAPGADLVEDLIMNSLYIGPTVTYQFTYMMLICLWIEITLFSRDQFLIQHERYNCVWKCVWGTVTMLIVSALIFIFFWASSSGDNNLITGLYKSLWIMTFVTPCLAFMVWILLMIRFAGFPYLNDVWKQQGTRMFYVVCVWTGGQLIAGIMLTIWTYVQGPWMHSDSYVWFSLSVALTLVISEIIPLLYTADWQRMGFLLMAFINWRDLWLRDERHGLAHDPRLMDDPLRSTHPYSLTVVSPSVNTPKQHGSPNGDHSSTALLSTSSPISDGHSAHSTHRLSREQFRSTKLIKHHGKNGNVDFSALRIDHTLKIPPYIYGSSNALYSTHKVSLDCNVERTSNVNGKGKIADLHVVGLGDIDFCLKIFECDAIDSNTMLQGVCDNLMKLKKLDHDHLAIMYAVNLKLEKHSGLKRIEILTPWYSGGSLYDIILMSPKDTPFAMHVIKRMMLQIANFMDWLHSICKMAHGHLKSRNILFDDEMNVCVTDIGLIGLKKTMTVLCPECCFDGYWMDRDYFEGKAIGKECDVWAFGFILYELVAKQQPFEEEQIGYIKRCIVNNSDLPQMPDHCDSFLKDLVAQCWNPDRSKRPTFRNIVDQIQTQMS